VTTEISITVGKTSIETSGSIPVEESGKKRRKLAVVQSSGVFQTVAKWLQFFVIIMKKFDFSFVLEHTLVCLSSCKP
jgi:hypothetical protein